MWVLVLAGFLGACDRRHTPQNPDQKSNPLLLISFDGFRYDYLSKTDTPHFDQLIKNGVKSEGLIPIFPTKTYPNHYAIATGLYPENNGLISNNMIDPQTGDRYSLSNRDAVEDPKWYQGEPVWNTAEKQEKKTGNLFWVGSETPIQNMRPTYWESYDGSLPDSARIDTIASWLTEQNSNRVDFASLYFSFSDTQGHRFGPDSTQIIEAIRHADNLIGYLVEKLKLSGLFEITNIIIVSDHGMAEVSRERVVVLNEMVNPDLLEITDIGPLVMMNVKDGQLQTVYTSLKENQKHFNVFKKEEIPERYHLTNHPRVPEILLIPDAGFSVYTREYLETNPGYPPGGAHGYDNQAEEMHALFLAHGPLLRKGFG